MSLKLRKRLLVELMIIPMFLMAVFTTAITSVATESGEPVDEARPADETQPADTTQPADETQPADGTETSTEGAELLDDVFGEVVFYRWDRVGADNYPRLAEWVPCMFVWARDDFEIDDGYIGCLAPDCIWMGPTASPVPGATHTFTESDPIYDDLFDGSSIISEGESHYCRLTDRAEGIDVGSDPQVLTYEKTFYTDDDRDVLYLKYGGTDEDNHGVNGEEAPRYMIKLASTPDAPQEYILEPGGQGNDSWIHIRGDEYGYEWTLESFESEMKGDSKDDVMFKIKYNKAHEDDPRMSVGEGQRFMHARSEDYDWNKYKWFTGKKLRYSSIKGDVTIGAGQLLSISAGQYVASDGNPENQQGVILPAGQTITVEQGGILSVSGDFINNGTIVNNGGVIIVQNGGNIYPFLQGDNANTMGCGSIKCNGGDIIIEEGGAIYTGLNCAMTQDGQRNAAAFWLDNSSTVINYGLICCGEVQLGDATTVENRSNGRIYSCLWEPNWKTFVNQLKDNDGTLISGSTDNLINLGYFKAEDKTVGGIHLLNGGNGQTNVPSVYVTKGKESFLNNPDVDWQATYINQGLIYYGLLEL